MDDKQNAAAATASESDAPSAPQAQPEAAHAAAEPITAAATASESAAPSVPQAQPEAAHAAAEPIAAAPAVPVLGDTVRYAGREGVLASIAHNDGTCRIQRGDHLSEWLPFAEISVVPKVDTA